MSGNPAAGEQRGFRPSRLAARGTGERAQTVLDFVVGMSVFLLAVGFTFAFVPSLLEPFTAGEGAKMVVAERSAAHLTETALSEGGSPATISAYCTRNFFASEDPADHDRCDWTSNADDLHAELGVADHLGLNVTITDRGEPIGIDANDEILEDPGASALSAGSPPPRDASVAAASRMVDIDGETYRLRVRVW